MTTALICITGALAVLIIAALIGFEEMSRRAKANPDHWFHS